MNIENYQNCKDLSRASFARCSLGLRLGLTITVMVLSACSSKLTVTTTQGAKTSLDCSATLDAASDPSACAPLLVRDLSQIVATPGKPVKIIGENFRSSLEVSTWNLLLTEQRPAAVRVISSTEADVTLPDDTGYGPQGLFLTQDGVSAKLTLFSDGGKTDYPVITPDPSQICTSTKFYDVNGNLRQGTKGCEADIPACEEDGDKNCVASDEYPAVKRAQILPQKILTGVTIAGVSGTVAACTSDGDKNCVATDEFPAVEKQQLAEKVVSGTTVAGVAGEVVLPPANAVLSGVRVGASGTGMVTLPTASDVRQGVNFGVDASLTGSLSPGSTTLPNCSSDGATGCVAVSNFPAVDKATKLLAGNIKSGVSIAGITGGYPSAQYPLTGADSTVADLPLFSATTGGTSYEWFKGDGTRVTGSIEANAQVTPGISAQTLNAGLYRSVTVAGDADLVAGKILTGIDIFGVVGNVAAKPADCAADGATGCVAVSNFPAVDKATKLLAGNIKSGVSIAGITGGYPSAQYPLTGADSTVADLPAFSATTGGTSYEWFKGDGTRVTGSIEANAQVTPGTSAQTLNAGLYR